MIRRPLILLAFLLVLAGCALSRREPLEQRTTQGPTADDFWKATVVAQNGREPNFEEKRHWESDINERIAKYLREHPNAANDLEVSTFRFLHQVSVGMDKEQVQILLGPPAAVSTSAPDIEKVARKYWPQIKDHANEAWAYPFGWVLYFSGPRLVDITQYIPGT